jgi:hypothetical protein
MKTQPTPQSVLQQIGAIPGMEKGKLCVLRQGPGGAYYNHQTWEHGKNTSRYVARDQVPALEEAIAGYEQFQDLTEQYAQLIIAKSRAERATGAKKKNSRPRSSWPKTRKSSN